MTHSFNWVLITQKNIRKNKNKIASCATLWYDYLLFGENRYVKKPSLYVFIQFKTPQNVDQVTKLFPDFFCTTSIDCRFCIEHIRKYCYSFIQKGILCETHLHQGASITPQYPFLPHLMEWKSFKSQRVSKENDGDVFFYRHQRLEKWQKEVLKRIKLKSNHKILYVVCKKQRSGINFFMDWIRVMTKTKIFRKISDKKATDNISTEDNVLIWDGYFAPFKNHKVVNDIYDGCLFRSTERGIVPISLPGIKNVIFSRIYPKLHLHCADTCEIMLI